MSQWKILVGYHKPAKICKSDIYEPIHLGRALATEASKDGEISQEDYQWMLDNMIGDDTGDNISKENRKYCELTGLYWAWKNYDKLGNPDYIGLCHYRRVINVDNLNTGADVYIAPVWKSPETALIQYKNFHKSNEFDIALEIISSDYPEYKESALKYCNSNNLHLLNIFVMKREIFFDYVSWLFEILSKIEQKISYEYRSFQSLRGIACVAERLQDIYVLKLKSEGYKIEEVALFEPQKITHKPLIPFNNARIIVTSCDDNYSLYAGSMLQSVISNLQTDLEYRLYILDAGISVEHKKKIKKIERKNIHIDFINMDYYNEQYGGLFKTNTHFTPATYYRFFIPEIFQDFDKVLYLDPDMIIERNVGELFDLNLDDYLLAACRDVEAERKSYEILELKNYFNNILHIKNIHNYFQAGVLIYNIKEMIKFDFIKHCLHSLEEVGSPMWVDQDILNSVVQNRVYFLDPQWNYEFFLSLDNSFILNNLDYRIYDVMKNVEKHPYIIHYCGGYKPWNDASLPLADHFWKYARQTPFYEEILYQNLKGNTVQKIVNMDIVRDIKNYSKNRFNYYRCKIMANLTFGKLRKHYKDKKKKLKAKIKEVRKFLKGK